MIPVCLDLETWPVERARLAPTIVCGSFCADYVAIQVGEQLQSSIMWALWSPEHFIINAFPAFDMACICANYPNLLPAVFAKYEAGQVHDVLLREKMIDIARGTDSDADLSLAEVASRYGIPINKETTWRLEYPRLANVPLEHWPAEAREYSLRDAEVPLEIWYKQEEINSQWKERTGHELLHRSGEEAFASFSLYLASAHGVKTNRERVCALQQATRADLLALRRSLQDRGLVCDDTKRNRRGMLIPNPVAGKRDTKATKTVMEAECRAVGVTPKRTATGEVCLDEDACLVSGSQTLIDYARYTSATKAMSEVDDLADGYELPLQARFMTMVDTYRTSSRKPKPPVKGRQMQNLGRDGGQREAFEPRPGKCFIWADVASMEAHFWAQWCHDMGFGTALLEALNAKRDVHRELASVAFNVPLEEVSEDQRQWCKAGNYGFPGGMGAAKFAVTQRKNTGAEYPVDRAESIRSGWLALWPESRCHLDWIGARCREGRTMRTKDSETIKIGTLRHPSTGVWRSASFCSLANFTFQHPSAIGVKRATNRLQKLAYVDTLSPFYGARIWNIVHDEIVAEVDIDRAHEAGQVLGEVLAWGVNSLLPNCPTKAPPVAAMQWSKHTKSKYVDGRLQVIV